MSRSSLTTAAFSQQVAERIGYYVYRLIDPRDGRTFYVGKGTGNRLFQHVSEASDLPDRSSLKFDRIRDIERAGERVRYVVHRHSLTSDEALLVESALIDAYEDLTNIQLGHGTHDRGLTTVDDLVATYETEDAVIDVPTVLVNLRRQYERALTPEQLYERTRGHWTFNPDRHPTVRYAMAFALGVIREVYTIETWQSARSSDIVESALRRVDHAVPRADRLRWSFQGSVATHIRDRFVGKSFVWPGQSSFLWKNC